MAPQGSAAAELEVCRADLEGLGGCLLRGGPWRADGVTKYDWTSMLRRLKLPAIRLYDARHSCATMLRIERDEKRRIADVEVMIIRGFAPTLTVTSPEVTRTRSGQTDGQIS